MSISNKLINKIKQVPPSMTLAITARAKSMRSNGVDIVNFAAGEPDFDTPDIIKDAAKEAMNNGFTKYTPASGTPELRQAICRKLKRDNGLDYDPSQVIVSCGAKHSLFNIFQVICEPGDEVIVPSPYWLSYPEMVRLAGATPVFAESQRGIFKLTADVLKKSITERTKAVIINSPSNPTGAVYTREELSAIADVAIAADIAVISDEIYENLLYDGAKHVSIASLGREIYARTLVVNGVSKSYSMTGWRIGYAASSDTDVMKAIGTLQSHSTSNPASISQIAAVAALEKGAESVRIMRAEFEKRRIMMCRGLSAVKPLKCELPGGAFYVFVDISGTGMDSITFAEKALEEAHVALIPGKPFGWDDHVRVSFATGEKDIEKGIERLGKWVKQ